MFSFYGSETKSDVFHTETLVQTDIAEFIYIILNITELNKLIYSNNS